MLYNYKMNIRRGFTIVELLIVIVVIGILAAISFVSYSAVSQKALVASLQSDLTNAISKIEVYKASSATDSYPLDSVTAGIVSSNGSTITYKYQSGARGYCVEASSSGLLYSVTNLNTTPQSVSCTVNGLAAWWKFNGDMNDSSGNGKNLTNNGATSTTGQNGAVNNAFSFNGAGNNATVANVMNMNNDFTISMWIKGSEISSWRWILNLNNYGTANDGGITFTTNAYKIRWSYGAWFTDALLVANTTTDSVSWYHVAFGRSGGTLFSYLNGASAGIFQNAASNNINTSASLKLGQGPSGSDWYGGSLDDVRIYNRALSTSEISSIYTSGAQ